MNDKKYETLNNLNLRKSNNMVTAKYQSSLLENQVMAIALTRIEVNNNDMSHPLVAKLYPGELKKLIVDPDHIYRSLKTISSSMTGRRVIIEDGNGNFNAFAMITNAKYENGVFEVRFNDELKKDILGLELRGNYTTLELSILSSFRRNSSFRLYELLKKEMYKLSSNSCIEVEYGIAELKFMLGLIDSDSDIVKDEIASYKKVGQPIDWDAVYEKAASVTINTTDKNGKPKTEYLTKYNDWRDFQRCVLKVAQEELEEKSNIRFEYEPIRLGRKIKRIKFILYKIKPVNASDLAAKSKIIDDNKVSSAYIQEELTTIQFAALFQDYIGHNELTKEDINLLLQKSNYDESVVRRAINYADAQENINNYMGWIIKCIENNYNEVPVVNGSSEEGQEAKKLMKDMEDTKDVLAARMWKKIKNKPEFDMYTEYLESMGISIDAYEIMYTADERNREFSQWLIQNNRT